MAFSKTLRRQKIKQRIRKRITGTTSRPRLSVFRSNKQISVQLIDDTQGKTLTFASSLEKDFEAKGTKTQVASEVGKRIAQKAIAAGHEAIVFDRNGYLYHGRVKALADAAREAGLKF